MRLNSDVLIVFSGRMFAGKDYAATKAGLTIKGFADPLYQLTEYFFGTSDKSIPGVRQMLQRLGQWGWGCLNEEYPATPERAAIVHAVRKHGEEMTKDFRWANWPEYGKRQDFWVNICLTRLGLIGTRFNRIGPGSLFSEHHRKVEPYTLAITNARFVHELTPCKSAGFDHYHIRCSEETRRERMAAKGYQFNERADNDASECLAKQFDNDLADTRIIWNDVRPAPQGRSFLSVDDFCRSINDRVWQAQQPQTQTTTSVPYLERTPSQVAPDLVTV